MSPVDRAGSVSEISPRHSFLQKKKKIPMCSKAGWGQFLESPVDLPVPKSIGVFLNIFSPITQ